MAERFKAAVLKTVERKLRGFESLLLRWFSLDQECGFRQEKRPFGEVAERLKAAAC